MVHDERPELRYVQPEKPGAVSVTYNIATRPLSTIEVV
jgi:hypothetical protein